MSRTSEAGLAFPADLEGWRRWSRTRRPIERTVRAAKHRLRPAPQAPPTLHLPPEGEGEVETLVVLDVLSPSCRAAVLDPVAHLDPARTALLAPAPLDPADLPTQWQPRSWSAGTPLPGVRQVLTLGTFNALAEQVVAWARRLGARHVVVQHGLLTRWAPPLADGDHLLAWSEADADYWSAGRSSITSEVVGSQLLSLAGRQPQVPLKSERAVMLGQLHGVELNRREALRTYVRFGRSEGVDYRPHPNERDLASRAAHQVMRRAGVRFADEPGSLLDLGRPVVSIFSTGTLEAAQRGLPAWVAHADPPPWVEDLWERYGLSRWGADPTPAWPSPPVEPAAAVAAAVT